MTDPEGDRFRLEIKNKKSPFLISSDGILTVNGALDREAQETYNVDILGAGLSLLLRFTN